MARLTWTGLVLATLATAGVALAQVDTGSDTKSGDNLTWFSDEDEAMQTAIASARSTLPVFWDLFDANPELPEAFALKAGLPTNSDSTEHIWVSGLSHDGDQISGFLANEPVDLRGDYQLGDQVSFATDQVSDWTIWSEGKQFGGFTVRVIADTMAPERRAALLATFHETPLP